MYGQRSLSAACLRRSGQAQTFSHDIDGHRLSIRIGPDGVAVWVRWWDDHSYFCKAFTW
jgi:hypothetical protein